jgi:hypothetical protein
MQSVLKNVSFKIVQLPKPVRMTLVLFLLVGPELVRTTVLEGGGCGRWATLKELLRSRIGSSFVALLPELACLFKVGITLIGRDCMEHVKLVRDELVQLILRLMMPLLPHVRGLVVQKLLLISGTAVGLVKLLSSKKVQKSFSQALS